ncbi:replication factor C subunit 1 [Plasmodium inui San Antonio 1]|uniref:Replication factor C subunit 1 n=1 Tax=Plasmodium inui San Antonio 1 TaxID=1237626 RepID=W7A4Q4_9APIC|nr:replication factor C subunit 1 [Plasmodium inui San Antonio 1]EUD66720.1 replication factor C subunit 1 [Plasmodium inui San Antonio 1]
MSFKGKKLLDDDRSSDVGRKRKRLKKVSSSLFDSDDDDNVNDWFNKGEDTNSSQSKSVVEINDEEDAEQKDTYYTTGTISNRSLPQNASSKPMYHDITSYFKPSSKKMEDQTEADTVGSTHNVKGIARENISLFDMESKKFKKESPHTGTELKRQREEHISNMIDQHKYKRKHTSPGKGEIKEELDFNSSSGSTTKKKNFTSMSTIGGNNNKDDAANKFDYLPFHSLKFVLTGVFKNFSRDELGSKIKEHGGSVMSAVSSKTHYLIHGEYLEDGRMYDEGRKYQKAFELQKMSKSIIKILNEEELLQMLPQEKDKAPKGGDAANGEDGRDQFEKSSQSDFTKIRSESGNNGEASGSGSYKSIAYSENKNSPKFGAPADQHEILNQLWVEKYRPKNLNELVGNNQNVLKLKNWLASWDDVCIKGLKKQVTKTFRGVFENVNARCALLSGSAGIGKTTTAKIVAESSGYNVIEFNASDERNKAAVEKISEMATGGYSIASIKSRKLTKTCIIMDEVDGMSSGDKGGSAAILKLIEKTKCPIICICNDRQNSKMRTLANKCYDLKFTTPNKNSVVKRLLEICKQEDIMMEPNALELLWESTNGDLRQMLNALQLLSKTYKRIQFLDLKKELNNSNKNIQSLANPFEITLKLLNFHESSKLKIREIMDLFFVDYELIPFFISENYTNVFNDNDKSAASINKWNAYSQISYDLTLAEKIKYNMKTTMDFSLLPHFSILSCVCPVMRIKMLKSFMSGRINFPSAFGKISTFNKNKRLLNEVCFNMSYKLNVSPKHMVTSGFLNYIYAQIISPLQSNNIAKAIQLMEEYNVTREMITENIPCLRLPTQENLYDKLDSKIKASFTRLYNASHVIKNDPNIMRKGMKSTEKKTSFKLNEYESDEDIDELSESKEEKDDDVLVTSKVDKKPASKSKATPRSNTKKR